jgi:hypothetical protein
MKHLESWVLSIRRLGSTLLGNFWYPLCRDTVQDTLGAYFTLSIGGVIGKCIAGKDFSSFKVCFSELQSDPTGITPYACYGMVTLDFILWIVILSRLLYRSMMPIMPKKLKNQQEKQQLTKVNIK